jgi:hypothetical protein
LTESAESRRYSINELLEVLDAFPNVPADIQEELDNIERMNNTSQDMDAGTLKLAPDGPPMRRATLGERLKPIQDARKYANLLMETIKVWPTEHFHDSEDRGFQSRLYEDLGTVCWMAKDAEEWVRKHRPKNKQRQRSELLAGAISRLIKRLTGSDPTNGYDPYTEKNTGSFPTVAHKLAPILGIEDEIESIIESHRKNRPD